MNITKIILVLLVASTIFACKKDEASKTELLTEKSWILTELTVDPAYDLGGVSITDLYAQLDDCDKDDLTTFKTSGDVLLDEGATKCDASSPQTQSGTWEFQNNESEILLTDPDNVQYTYKILELTETRLKVSFTQLDFDGKNRTYTIAYQKQ